MYWPTLLPLAITFWLFVIITVILTIFAPSLKWKRKKTFLVTTLIASVMLIPSCTGLMFIMDFSRFGIFEYKTYDDVQDFRVERYLPSSSKNITLQKGAPGYHAKYEISEEDFHVYLNDQWRQHGEHSAIKREDLSFDAMPVGREEFDGYFKNLHWLPSENVIKYHGPIAGNGAGATYFLDRDRHTVYHYASYW